jgi:hypothetical protein
MKDRVTLEIAEEQARELVEALAKVEGQLMAQRDYGMTRTVIRAVRLHLEGELEALYRTEARDASPLPTVASERFEEMPEEGPGDGIRDHYDKWMRTLMGATTTELQIWALQECVRAVWAWCQGEPIEQPRQPEEHSVRVQPSMTPKEPKYLPFDSMNAAPDSLVTIMLGVPDMWEGMAGEVGFQRLQSFLGKFYDALKEDRRARAVEAARTVIAGLTYELERAKHG